MSIEIVFRDLPIGAVFVMNRDDETDRYVKIAPRKYQDVHSGGLGLKYRAVSILITVWQPCSQPAEYAPKEGLRVWLDEYDRLTNELRIFREVNGSDDDFVNYPAILRHRRDVAGARMAAYAGLVLDMEAK